MSKEKKQFLVLGVLALLVCAVGAFQFMGPKSKPAVVAEDDEKPVEKLEPNLVAVYEIDPTQRALNQLMMGPQSDPRDPFAPQAVMVEEPKQHVEQVLPPVDRVASRPRSEFDEQSRITAVNPFDLGQGESIKAVDSDFGLLGVVIGRRTVAVFQTEDGQFELAEVGEKVGKSDSTLVEEITDKQVTLRHRGKLRHLELRGGN